MVRLRKVMFLVFFFGLLLMCVLMEACMKEPEAQATEAPAVRMAAKITPPLTVAYEKMVLVTPAPTEKPSEGPLDALYLLEQARAQIRYYRENPPAEEAWEPSDEDIAYVSRTVWGEVRGCDYIEQRAQVWCILNRVDDPRWPDTIAEVVLAPSQFQGYSINNPVEPFWDLAREILIMWHNGEREIPTDMCFCSGKNGHQTFRTDWIPNENTRYYP